MSSTFVIRALLTLIIIFSTPSYADNDQLARLADQDQAVRQGRADTGSDDERRRLVLEIIAAGEATTPRDKFNAAIVLQHTGLTFCEGQLKSVSAENYLLAHFLFRDALAAGVPEAGYLSAAAIDRYLSFTKGIQRYGTNRIIDQESGKELLVPIDRSVTDDERVKLGVPALQDLLARWPEQQVNTGT